MTTANPGPGGMMALPAKRASVSGANRDIGPVLAPELARPADDVAGGLGEGRAAPGSADLDPFRAVPIMGPEARSGTAPTKRTITDTGPLIKMRKETIDDDTADRAAAHKSVISARLAARP